MTPRLLITFTLFIGLGLFLYSLNLPYYNDQNLAKDLLDNSFDMDDTDYYKKEAELRTSKVEYMDLGSGITIASITILLFLIYSNVKTFNDFEKISSFSKTETYISANLVWLILLPGTYWYYLFRAGRGDYPPFADTVGVPIMTQIPIILFLLIPLNLFIFVTTSKTILPTKLISKPNLYSKPIILWEIFFGFWILINLLFLVLFVGDGDHFSIPVNLFFTYILLNLRAGQINRYENIGKNVSLNSTYT